MQLKDYFTAAALLISLASLAMSIRVYGFNRRAKSAELRAALLGKIVEASVTQSRIARYHAESLYLAFHHGGPSQFEDLQEMNPQRLSDEIMQLYDRIASIPKNAALTSYEEYFHEVHRVAERSKEQEAKMLEIKSLLDKRR